MDFSQGAGQQAGNGTIPNGQLAWAFITVRAIKPSNSGGQYIDIELTLDDNQPFARRKIFEKVGDPLHTGNSDAYRQMGQIAIARILESGRGAGPNNPAGYQIGSYQDLNGLRVPIKIGVKPPKDGYDEDNKVAEWLTPNPASETGFKGYEKLARGETNMTSRPGTPANQPAANGFGGAPQQQQRPQQGFGGQPQQGASGFGGAPQQQQPQGQQGNLSNAQPQGNQQWGPTPGNNAAAAATSSGQTGNASASPSDQPSWLAQANGNPA
jgi:hypothetical protein